MNRYSFLVPGAIFDVSNSPHNYISFAPSCPVYFYVCFRDSGINNTTPNFRWQVQLLLMLEVILKHFNF